jgi:hypothetical protein
MSPEKIKPRTDRVERFYRAEMFEALLKIVSIYNPSAIFDAKAMKYSELVVYVRDCLVLEADEVTAKGNDPPSLPI